MNLVANRPPAVDGPVEAVVLDRSHCPVERDPGHRLRVDEVTSLAADLPDAVVRFPPGVLEMVEQAELDAPTLRIDRQAGYASLVEAVETLAVAVELELSARGVPPPPRLRAFVAVEPGELE